MSRRRRILKTAIWIVSTDLFGFMVTWWLTGNAWGSIWATLIIGVFVAIFYYVYEMIWERADDRIRICR